MEAIGDLLGRFSPREPAEVLAVKRYINDNFGADSSIALRDEQLIITVKSAALATTLRLRTPQIQRLCKTSKRLVFRIG